MEMGASFLYLFGFAAAVLAAVVAVVVYLTRGR